GPRRGRPPRGRDDAAHCEGRHPQDRPRMLPAADRRGRGGPHHHRARRLRRHQGRARPHPARPRRHRGGGPGADRAGFHGAAREVRDRPPYPAPMDLTPALVRSLPKVALHDHLDGGVRPATVLELSREAGLTPPGEDAAQVADWFHTAAGSGSLPAYLSTFEHTVAVMQTAPQLRRIAREFVEDMVEDGVIYAETRWAPHQHTEAGLSLDDAVQAVQDGLDDGVAAAEAAGRRIIVGQLLCYLRHL